MLGALRVKVKSQALSAHDGHRFDVFAIEDPETGKESKFYFNIDLPQKALSKVVRGMLEGRKEEGKSKPRVPKGDAAPKGQKVPPDAAPAPRDKAARGTLDRPR